MRMLAFFIAFILIECSVGAAVMDCSSELDDYKELVQAKASLKFSLVSALSRKQMQIMSQLQELHEEVKLVYSIDIQTINGDTLLMIAARNGLPDVVDKLLNLKSTITVSQNTVAAATEQAIEAGFQDVVEILRIASLEDGNVDEKDGNLTSNNTAQKEEDVSSALHKAVKVRDLDKVEMLIKSPDVDVNSHRGRQGYTPLHWAAEEGQTEIVKLLLSADGIDVNSLDIYEKTPFYLAASYGHLDTVKWLVNAPGLDVNSKDYEGRTPLSIAVKNGHTELADLLVNTPGIDMSRCSKRYPSLRLQCQ